jgi:hypothetical protein
MKWTHNGKVVSLRLQVSTLKFVDRFMLNSVLGSTHVVGKNFILVRICERSL